MMSRVPFAFLVPWKWAVNHDKGKGRIILEMVWSDRDGCELRLALLAARSPSSRFSGTIWDRIPGQCLIIRHCPGGGAICASLYSLRYRVGLKIGRGQVAIGGCRLPGQMRSALLYSLRYWDECDRERLGQVRSGDWLAVVHLVRRQNELVSKDNWLRKITG